ncbi:hypothetical protein BDN72DRAFT_902156 [Pluteus cervinus]|uniref:Uncharacterized protein n=1 Tax=Pluteus cervinus TaxID=181527 RepID=A0ACD3ADV6_9AGAR|nr:hypothetical protein BDN72DRAFT_902156 [Pluteus cervinus]
MATPVKRKHDDEVANQEDLTEFSISTRFQTKKRARALSSSLPTALTEVNLVTPKVARVRRPSTRAALGSAQVLMDDNNSLNFNQVSRDVGKVQQPPVVKKGTAVSISVLADNYAGSSLDQGGRDVRLQSIVKGGTAVTAQEPTRNGTALGDVNFSLFGSAPFSSTVTKAKTTVTAQEPTLNGTNLGNADYSLFGSTPSSSSVVNGGMAVTAQELTLNRTVLGNADSTSLFGSTPSSSSSHMSTGASSRYRLENMTLEGEVEGLQLVLIRASSRNYPLEPSYVNAEEPDMEVAFLRGFIKALHFGFILLTPAMHDEVSLTQRSSPPGSPLSGTSEELKGYRRESIALQGEIRGLRFLCFDAYASIAPTPDYPVYLNPEEPDLEAAFLRGLVKSLRYGYMRSKRVVSDHPLLLVCYILTLAPFVVVSLSDT